MTAGNRWHTNETYKTSNCKIKKGCSTFPLSNKYNYEKGPHDFLNGYNHIGCGIPHCRGCN